MKKTAVFVSGILMLCVVYLLGYGYINNQFQIPSNLIKGDRKAMGDVVFTSSFVNHDALINIEYDKTGMNIKKSIATGMDRYPTAYLYEDRFVNDLFGSINYVRDDMDISNSFLSCEQGYDEYTELSYADVLYTFNENNVLDHTIQLPMDLKETSGKSTFKIHRYMCHENGKDVSNGEMFEVEAIDEQNPAGAYFQDAFITIARKAGNNSYYFLPGTNLYTKGDVYVYWFMKTSKEAERLFMLPKGRCYETLRVINDQLIVFSNTEDTLYLSKYQPDGTLIQELSVPFVYDPSKPKVTLYTNGSLVTAYLNDELKVFDVEHMKVVDTIPHETTALYDAFYQDGRMYVNEKAQNGWRILVYEGTDCVLQEEIILSKDDFEGYHMGILNYGTFKKVEG